MTASRPHRKPREQLLVCEEGGEMALALFIHPAVLQNLATHDPGHRLGEHNLGDFLLAVEGVSHFIYAAICARAERPVTQLELELQAEVDKYVTCLLDNGAGGRRVRARCVIACSRTRNTSPTSTATSAIAIAPRTITRTAMPPGSRRRSSRAGGFPRCSRS